jgi:hypothetical protein
MPKAISKITFLLRKENKNVVVAKKGEAVTVTSDELKKFSNDLIELKK